MYQPQKTRGALLLSGVAAVLLLPSVAVQAQSSITNGLVAYWNFDNKDYKDSVGKFDGTPNGTAPIQFVAGKNGFGQAMKLDGVDEFVEITGRDATYDPDQLAFPGGSISVAGWFTVGTFDKSWQALIAKGEGTNWRVHRNSANSTMAYAGGIGEGPNDGPAIDDGGWHHFVAVTDANAVNFGTAIYVDGVQTSVNAGQPTLNTNGKNMKIGDNPDATGRYWNGLVDDLAIWTRVLTEDEIKLLYNGGTGKAVSTFFAPLVDSDGDGMPDDWEIKYGLNPHDPSDAAKDCNNNGVTNLQEYKLGLDPCDVTPPAVVSTSGNATFDAVKLTFSEPLDPAGATNLANYSISGLSVTNVTYKNKVVTLSTGKQTPATSYTVSFKGIADLSKNVVPAGSSATVQSYVMTTNGVLKFSYYGDATGGDAIPGTDVGSLTSDPRYPTKPDLVLPVYSFNSRDAFPDDTHDNYGDTIEGYLTPSATDKYTFFLSSDDGSQLWLSTDSTPANLQLIAEEVGCCQAFLEPDPTGANWHDNGSGMGQTSLTPISLTAGKHYYIQTIHKEGGGGDFTKVAWRKAGDTNAAAKLQPIPGTFLSSTLPLPAPPTSNGGGGSGASLKASVSGKSLTISWAPTGGTLESTAALATNAVWTTVGTANPATVTIGTGNSYYRVRQ
jgi:hypothetical protein